MVELGDYAREVLLAYAGSILLLIGIVWLSLRRAARVRRELARTESHTEGRS